VDPPNKRYDVIIVGAGPAGSTTAIALRRKGRSVLLVDRSDFPRNKSCGDGIPPGTVEILNDLGMADHIRGAGFYPINSIRLVSPGGRVWEAEFRSRRGDSAFYIAPRVQFDNMLLDYALDQGAEFLRANVQDLLIDRERVVGVQAAAGAESLDLQATVVVGADGATSTVARRLGVKKREPSLRGVAVRAYVDGIDTLPNRVEFYFLNKLLPGYGWVFPLGPDRANVGVITRADRFKVIGERLEDLMHEFLASKAMTGRVGETTDVHDVDAWQLTYAHDLRNSRVFEGAILVGDAGAYIDALTGEGIHNALLTAVRAAQTIDEALTSGECTRERLVDYDTLCRDSIGQLVKRSHRAQNWIARFPWMMELVFIYGNRYRRRVERYINRVSTNFMVRT